MHALPYDHISNMNGNFLRFLLPAATVAAGLAQNGATPEFEVASLKISAEGPEAQATLKQNFVPSPGSIRLENVTLSSAIEWAFDVRRFQVSGPGWVGEARYDIAAKAGESAGTDQLRLMLRKLLGQRLKLAVHDETRELRVYALEVAKQGHKMKPSDSAADPSVARRIRGITMPQLADILSGPLQVPVIDMTGLNGPFDFSLNLLSKIPEGASTDPLSAISAALEQELGLRIEARKMPIHLIVIDHAERTPIGN